MRKKSTAYTRHQATLRAARKRQADKDRQAPSMPQLTNALGFAARAFIAQARAEGRLDEVRPMVDATLDRLRESGFKTGPVTVSRLLKATTRKAPVTTAT